MKGMIFDIKRFAVHDGDGIRTTVFFKGCPLKCKWCHNPEGMNFKPETAFYSDRCISCGECAPVCPQNAHSINNGIHKYDRSLCRSCGICEQHCPSGAMKSYGKETTEDELLSVLLEDKAFYDNSGGGVTLSGGECLLQADFCAVLLKKLKENNIHTAVDTCGYAPPESLDKVIPYTDVFLYDIKAFDEDCHIKCTGKSNKIILDNLRYISSVKIPVEIRYPFVPGFNSDQADKIAAFLSEFDNIVKVKVLPCHSLSASKYNALGIKDTQPCITPSKNEIFNAEKIFKRYGF